MNSVETEKQLLVTRIARLRRLRQWWLICWVPGAYFIYVGFHELTNAFAPYWAMVVLLAVWTLVGYGVSAVLYRRIVTPAWDRPPFCDLISLYSPQEAGLR